MNRTKKLITSLVAAAVLGLGATAQAQETPPPTETPPPPPPASHHSSSSGDGAGIGVGAGVSLTGATLAQFVYDQAVWHLEGLLTFQSNSNPGGADRTTIVGFGAGGWYHFHRGASSDFSLGAAPDRRHAIEPRRNSTTVTEIRAGRSDPRVHHAERRAVGPRRARVPVRRHGRGRHGHPTARPGPGHLRHHLLLPVGIVFS